MSAADWFHNAVVDGITRLVALALPGTPPAETVTLTAQVWVQALWRRRIWDEEQDMPRLAAAFARMESSVERWPAPAHLLQALPAARHLVELPAPALSAQERRSNLARLAEVRQRLAELLTRPRQNRVSTEVNHE